MAECRRKLLPCLVPCAYLTPSVLPCHMTGRCVAVINPQITTRRKKNSGIHRLSCACGETSKDVCSVLVAACLWVMLNGISAGFFCLFLFFVFLFVASIVTVAWLLHNSKTNLKKKIQDCWNHRCALLQLSKNHVTRRKSYKAKSRRSSAVSGSSLANSSEFIQFICSTNQKINRI